MRNKTNNSKGFTLVETIVVIAILSVLSVVFIRLLTLTLTSYNNIRSMAEYQSITSNVIQSIRNEVVNTTEAEIHSDATIYNNFETDTDNVGYGLLYCGDDFGYSKILYNYNSVSAENKFSKSTLYNKSSMNGKCMKLEFSTNAPNVLVISSAIYTTDKDFTVEPLYSQSTSVKLDNLTSSTISTVAGNGNALRFHIER